MTDTKGLREPTGHLLGVPILTCLEAERVCTSKSTWERLVKPILRAITLKAPPASSAAREAEGTGPCDRQSCSGRGVGKRVTLASPCWACVTTGRAGEGAGHSGVHCPSLPSPLPHPLPGADSTQESPGPQVHCTALHQQPLPQ